MDYNHIKNYLEKFRNIISSKENNINIVSSILENKLSIKIDNKYIQIKPPFIYIKTSPLIKGEIMMNKEELLKDIAILIPGINILDIK